MTRSSIPDSIEVYAQSPIFHQDTVPKKLTKAHSTKPGTYGRLNVLSGALTYVVTGPPETRTDLYGGDSVLIRPEQVHYVSIDGPVKFQVDFMK
ncbi:DUF1971 domain-containing protein [Henriciella barbarensis]